jgi:hypothetical protein
MFDEIFKSGLNAAGTVAGQVPVSTTQQQYTNLGASAVSAGTGIPKALTTLGLISLIFKGADPRQVPAAQIEQGFTVGADNLYAVAKAGMITKEQAASGMQTFLQTAIDYLGQMKAQLGKAADKAAANIGPIIRNEITAVLALPSVPAVPIDLVKAQALYKANLPGAGAGWYPKSVAAGNSLADEFLKTLMGSVSSDAIAGTVASVAKSPVKLAGLGVAAFALVGLLRKFA